MNKPRKNSIFYLYFTNRTNSTVKGSKKSIKNSPFCIWMGGCPQEKKLNNF